MSVSIQGQSTIPEAVFRAYATKQGAHQRYLDAIPLWYSIGQAYNIAGDNAALQAAKETGWGNYPGVVPPEYHNWCGLKTREGGSNDDPGAHAQFPSDREGITAQFQHLAAYAAVPLPPGTQIIDPRYPLISQGTAKVYADLGTHWAPAADYGTKIETMIADARQYAKERPVAVFIAEVDMTNWNGPNRPGYPMTAQSITVHETANPTPGADAMMHAKFVQGGGGSEGVSFHHSVDDHEAVRILPDNENAWHAGDGANGKGNRTSIAIETCVNSDGDWNKTKQNLVRLLAELCHEHGFPADDQHIFQHNHWSGKDCPHKIRAEGSFPAIIAQTVALLAGGGSAPSGDNRYFDETHHNLSHGFKAYWESHGDEALSLFGFPISEEYKDENGVVVQYFERARFEWHPEYDTGNDWHVQLGRIGAEDSEKAKQAHPDAFAPQPKS